MDAYDWMAWKSEVRAPAKMESGVTPSSSSPLPGDQKDTREGDTGAVTCQSCPCAFIPSAVVSQVCLQAIRPSNVVAWIRRCRIEKPPRPQQSDSARHGEAQILDP